MMSEGARSTREAAPRGRLLLGAAVLIFGWLCPLFVPLVLATGWPGGWKTTISGLLVLGIPELFTLAAVAIMGKSGFDFLKARASEWLRRIAPPDEVGVVRYRVGLVLFLSPLLFAWASVYLAGLIPGYVQHSLVFAIAGDAMLIVSLFVLGGDFWDKLRALFVHGSKAHFPASTT